MKKIFIYDPPMCCSTGVCGPNPDPILIGFQDTIDKLKLEGIEVERYLITQSPEKFKENDQVIKLIQTEQLQALPITFFNNEVVFKSKYPTYEEIKTLINKQSHEN